MIKEKIPFVVKSGGNSPWSTIDSSGLIIDLSLMKNFTVDMARETATIQPGVLSKDINWVSATVHVLGMLV